MSQDKGFPKFDFHRTSDEIALMRDGFVFRIKPQDLTFFLDRLTEDDARQNDVGQRQFDAQYAKLKQSANYTSQVYGIFGYFMLVDHQYLILISEASIVGTLVGGFIYRVDKLQYVPLTDDGSMQISPNDQAHIDMIEKVQAEKAFYFSYDIDLTKNMQRTFSDIKRQAQEDLKNHGMHDKYNQIYREAYPNSVGYVEHFAVNQSLLKEFKNIEYSPFRIPCIFGYVHVSKPAMPDSSKRIMTFALISRKDNRRPGRRFVIRGLDSDGNAVNQVETEHMIINSLPDKHRVFSYVQTRGSIPLVWSMKPNLKWSPPVRIIDNFDYSRQAAQVHFAEQKGTYGKNMCINLIDKKGSQKRIGDQFTKLHSDLGDPDIGYVWFDFHGECKKMKWENLSRLVNMVTDQLDSYGRFQVDMAVGFDDPAKLQHHESFMINSMQKGVFRTNCMDCLDRTNVVQSVLSRNILHSQLQVAGLERQGASPSSDPFAAFSPDLEIVFRNSWADNADVMSYLYTGTPALKTDFTRTGRRTYAGAMDDGINSLTRYYINNFTDGYYVDCLDFLQQNLTAKDELRHRRKFFTPIKVQLVMIAISFSLVRFMLNEYWLPVQLASIPEGGETWRPLAFYWTVYIGVLIAGFMSIFGNGRKYIDDCSRTEGAAKLHKD